MKQPQEELSAWILIGAFLFFAIGALAAVYAISLLFPEPPDTYIIGIV